jgi:hypothetical protein
MKYDTFLLNLYGQDTRLALREHDWQGPTPRRRVNDRVNDRVTEAFSRWLEGMEEALDRKAAARDAVLDAQPVFIRDE